ncbi:MAG: DHH family phosphoesterase [Bacilli bacterium]|nr:DHH family phosphoesterase [Bacilli bacterium]
MAILKEKRKIFKAIRHAKTIFLMGHKDLDLDALGSCVGLELLLKKKKKDCYIVIDDKDHELGVEKVLRELEGCINVIKSENIDKVINPNLNKNLLIVLDTNKTDLVQSKDLLKKVDKKLVIDHHDLGKSTIKDAIMINDTNSSSTCEMITKLIEHNDVDIDSYYATILLSGIVLDTNNFTLKTSKDTYYAAFYLASLGASAKKVQYLLKQDIEEYKERQKLMTSIDKIDKKIAFTKAGPNTIYRREDLAKVADTLLFFNDIEASFVIGKIGKNTVGLSARSLGNYDIIKILEKLGGGGDEIEGAARFENTTLSKVEKMIKEYIAKEGE